MGYNDIDSAGVTSRGSGKSPAIFMPVAAPNGTAFETGDSAEAFVERFLAPLPDFHDVDSQSFIDRTSVGHLRTYWAVASKLDEPTVGGLSRVMRFDRKLESLFYEYAGLFEVSFRKAYAEAMVESYGPFALAEPKAFRDMGSYERFRRDYENMVRNKTRSKSSFLGRRSVEKYGEMPMWEAVEYLSLGTVSRLFKNTAEKRVLRAVGDCYDVPWKTLASWANTVCVARNTAAHYNRFIGKSLKATPVAMSGVDLDPRDPYYAVLILARLLMFDGDHCDTSLCYQKLFAQNVNNLLSWNRDLLLVCGVPAEWQKALFSKAVFGDNAPFDDTDGLDGTSPVYLFSSSPEWGSLLVMDYSDPMSAYDILHLSLIHI